MIKKLLLLICICLSFELFSQNVAIEIGEMNNGINEIKKYQTQLVKAFEWTFRDGTKITDIKIEQLSNTYFIVATCSYQGKKRMAAVDIDLVGFKFMLNEDAFFKMCSAVACENCKFFLENNKIVACKCEETGSISNHCHFRSSPAISFYANLQRAIKMSDKGE